MPSGRDFARHTGKFTTFAISHAQRARHLQALLADPQAPFPEHLLKPDAERQCVLGRWLEGEGKSRFLDDPHFKTIKALHDRLHETARSAAGLKKAEAGQMDAAKEKIDKIRSLSDAMQEQFKKWLKQHPEPRS